MAHGTRSRLAIALIVLGALVLAAAPAPAAPCPVACITFGTGGATECGAATAADTLVWTLPEIYRAAYATSAGRLTLYTKASGDPHQDASSALDVTDEFTITGPPPGTPLVVTARLSVSGVGLNALLGPYQYAVGSTDIGMRDGAAGEVRHTFSSASEPVVLDLPVAVPSGEPFTLTLFARGTVASQYFEGATWAEGQLSFLGLPADATVRSCGGYDSNGFAVPVHRSTWGDLKLRYR